MLEFGCRGSVGLGVGVFLGYLGSIPHPVMGTTRYYCRYIKVLLTPY